VHIFEDNVILANTLFLKASKFWNNSINSFNLQAEDFMSILKLYLASKTQFYFVLTTKIFMVMKYKSEMFAFVILVLYFYFNFLLICRKGYIFCALRVKILMKI
jgi:hypothetical protein